MLKNVFVVWGLLAFIFFDWLNAQSFTFQEIRDIPYYQGEDFHPKKHRLDLYLPKIDSLAPVVLFVHGGAWVFGDRNVFGLEIFFSQVGRYLASQGIAVAILSYRLGPRYKHPAQVVDIARAFRFLQEHIVDYRGDPNRLFLMGYSAGGHLVSLLAMQEKWLLDEGCSFAQIKGVINISGLYDLTKAKGVARYTFGEELQNASPLFHTKFVPFPIQLIQAEKDPRMLLESGLDFEIALKNHQVKVERNIIPERNHFTLVSSLGKKQDLTSNLILKFIRRTCFELDIDHLLENN